MRSPLHKTMVVAALAALATGASVAPAAAEGARTGRAGDSGAARMAGECTDPGFVGAIRFRNPLGLYDVECIRPESVRFPGPLFVTHCKPTKGGRPSTRERDSHVADQGDHTVPPSVPHGDDA